MSKIVKLVVCFCCMGVPAAHLHAEQLVHSGGKSTWSLKDDGKRPGENWNKPGFDDRNWRRGSGPFGFGEDGVETKVSSGEGDTVTTTTYFRTSFDVHDPEMFSHMLLTVRADDGYVAYLNGAELHRLNMPPGDVGADTYAAQRRDGFLERLYQQFVLPSEDLLRGDNVLAIEVHQAGRISSDLFLDLALSGLSTRSTGRPYVPENAREVTRLFRHSHYIGPDTRIPNGFLDGGRGMQVDEFGYAIAGREIMSVDREADGRLRDHLRYARSKELEKLNAVDRATRIARYIDRLFTPPEGRRRSEDRTRQFLAGRYPSQEVLLGHVPLLCGAGVCRHRSLLFKLMADDAGLKVALVRGNYGIKETNVGGHAWNELFLTDGKKVIVDVMNPQPDYYFPEVGERSLRGYRTVANQPKYPPGQEVPESVPAAAGVP